MNRLKLKKMKVALELALLITLSGCGSKDEKQTIYLGNSGNHDKITTINNDNGDIKHDGTISFENLEAGIIKIVTLKNGDYVFEPKLMGIYEEKNVGGRFSHYGKLDYIDLETGFRTISYYWHYYGDMDNEPDDVLRGKSFEIVDEELLFNYIIEDGWLQDDYDVNELIDFFNEKVKDNVECKEKRLVK